MHSSALPPHQTLDVQGSQPHDTSTDYAVLTEGDSRLPSHIMCAKCRGIFPRSSFKKRTTHAQAKGWGKSGAYKLEVISKNCTSCRPKLRPPRKLSAKELQTRAITGDLKMGAVQIEARIKQRIQDGKDGIRAGIHRKMAKKKQQAWDGLWKDVSKYLTTARARVKYLSSPSSSSASSTPRSSSRSSSFLLAYAQAVLEATHHAKQTITHNRRWALPLPETLPNNPTWTDILDKPTKEKLTMLYEAIPHAERVRMRQTSVLSVNNLVESSSTNNQGEVK